MVKQTKKIASVKILIRSYILVLSAVLLPAILVAQDTDQNVGSRLTSGRLASLGILAIGITGLIIGYRSNKRPAGTSPKDVKKGAIIAYILGLVCIVLSAIRVINTTGFGTGGGKAGSIVALLAGGITVVLATITLFRNQKVKSN